ncbi:MAG TPA: hypothetical protein VFU23_02880, partial [Gemmatimonadales bacterium]|nr:hypothetical protein [Gemmatimonadales bacterium]
MATELGGTQISSLMEVLPGIAQVLRSPVADAIVNLIRAACRVREFDLADADEMLNYAVRRNLMAADERERVLTEAKAIVQKRAERAAEREKPRKPAATPKPKAKAKVAMVKPVRPVHQMAHHGKPKQAKPAVSAKPHL